MNRNAIKKFAVWARKSLRDEVATNAARFGVTRSGVTEPHYVAGGMVIGAATFDQHITALYRALRDDLNARLRSKPLEHVVDELVDEMAYTWFNRLAALRFSKGPETPITSRSHFLSPFAQPLSARVSRRRPPRSAT